jgi:glycosyltransferase involved in cell wall biosynthesis
MDVVYNGIDPKEYEFNNNPEDYFLYLGRLNKEKGVVAGIELAKAANKKLVVAGNIAGPEEWNYFFREVQPRLNNENTSFVGEVDFNEKVRLLKNAKALIFPINRREPFGLVMIEAMACGTPVIAFDKGSVSEVIEDRKTGFVVEGKDQMIEAMNNIEKIKRKDCRKAVEKNFTLKQMVDKYEEIYKKLIS